jgi:hypothetical protein
MWRAWFLKNNMIFGSDQESIMGSAKFLTSYWETLCGIRKKGHSTEDSKGKAPMDDNLSFKGRRRNSQMGENQRMVQWKPLQPGW